jgi:glutamyl/glutaminyl-tRNA synthetase
VSELAALVEPRLKAAFGRTHRSEGTVFSASEWRETFLRAAREEMAAWDDVVRLAEPLLADEVAALTPEAREALRSPSAGEVLAAFADTLPTVEPFDYDTVDGCLRELRWRFKNSHGLSGRQVMYPIRAALTGTLTGPCLVVTIILLGRARCLQRATAAIG